MNRGAPGLILWSDDPDSLPWDVETDVLVIGAGGCGLVAALSAAQEGARVLVVEKEGKAAGNTALSQGMIPGAGSRLQREAGIHDSPELMARDIMAKNHGESDPELTLHVARQSGPLVDWLVDTLGIQLRLVTNFLYPGHSTYRVHAPASTKGVQLLKQLLLLQNLLLLPNLLLLHRQNNSTKLLYNNKINKNSKKREVFLHLSF